MPDATVVVVIVLGIILASFLGENLIKRYFREKEAFVDRLQQKCKGSQHGQD